MKYFALKNNASKIKFNVRENENGLFYSSEYVLNVKLLVLVVLCIAGSCLVYLQGDAELSNDSLFLRVDLTKILHNTHKNFLSVALDSSIIRKRWKNFNFDSPALLSMVSALCPAYFRFGGTASDCLIFGPAEEPKIPFTFPEDSGLCVYDSISCKSYHQNFTLSKKDWLRINKFVKLAGLELIFDLNVLLRNGEEWDPTNAIEIIKFSHANGLNLSWQLGNEPNSFEYVFNKSISGTQLAKDFGVLRQILNEIYKSHIMLVGPDVTRPRLPEFDAAEYIKEFLEEIKSTSSRVIDAVTWHHYYLNGRTSTVEDFINPSNFQVFAHQMQLVINTVMKISPELPIWLTETSDAYGGGAPNITDRFVGGFLWLDKLGLAAANGLQIVTRQSIFGGYYSLIDEDTKPLPDFWLSFLHKKLVGERVLRIELKARNNRNQETLRFYCHCTSPKYLNNGSGITIFGLNIGKHAQIIEVEGLKNSYQKDTYILTGEDGLQSRYSYLNGMLLQISSDGVMPAINPVIENVTNPIILPPYSMGFWVYHNIEAGICD